ncbi:MAG TPA: hypothetical protein PK926_04325 [Spirochaetota bacterium]|nr:hypothetical protein [Spirochaetota bacterium]HPI90997.1 hypothetical protein [Spirochaetota bacterium]HPR46808.1 hypothetical protein [Spirochaetota bacterium]
MNGEVLIQNVFNLFIVAIILEASIMAIFSLTAFKRLESTQPLQMARDALILILAAVLCYKVDILTLFRGTGIKLPYILDTVISALVLTRMTNFISDFLSRIRISD